jgi:pimeloyl-ACP methyl ester carboxylesterase
MKAILRLFMVIHIFSMFSYFGQSQDTEFLDITIDRNGIILKGRFYVPDGDGIFPTVILLHGFPGGEKDVLGIGNKLSNSGFNAITFNFSGTYKSQGEYSWENCLKDIKAVYAFINHPENIHRYKIDTAFIIIGGYSNGGGMAITYAATHPEIKAVFSIAGTDLGEFLNEYTSNPETQRMLDNAYARLSAPTGPIRFAKGGTLKEMIEMNFIALNPTFHLKKCAPLLAERDILLIGGWDDYFGSVENAVIDDFILPFYRNLQKVNAKLVKIIAFQDDHSFRKSREDIANEIIEWIKTAPGRE